jgi:hypothetical protein
MDELEEALRNIDVFCRVLVKKIAEGENGEYNNISLEPIENLLRRKYIRQDEPKREPNPSSPHLIPLPQLDEPLVDIFEDNNYVKVLVQCRCKDEEATVRTDADSVQICKKVCYTNVEGIEWCTTQCRKLDLPTQHLQISNIISKCNNNQVFEVEIPKAKQQQT